MKKETFYQLTGYSDRFSEAVNFVEKLLKNGIPLDSLMVNDWENSSATIVYITVPFGAPYNGGRNRQYQRFSDRDMNNAVRWYKKSLEWSK